MEDLGKQIEKAMRESLVRTVTNMELVKRNYQDIPSIPSSLVQKVWDSMDWDQIVKEVKDGVQDRLCKTIIEAMAEEAKTDIKKVLSVAGVREKLRMEVYPKLMKVLEGE
jgi:flagellar biosynthesis component FlhA